MTDIAYPIDASAGAPSFPAAQARVAQGALAAGRVDRPLGALSGVKPGSDPTISATSAAWTVTPFAAVVDPGTGLAVGPFLVAFTANKTGAINPADSVNPRIDRLDLQVPDDPAGASPLAPVIVYTAGAPAGVPAAPAAPARSIPLATITVPKVGSGSPAVLVVYPYTAAAGGIVPTRNTAGRPAQPYVGQYADDTTLGLMRWDGTAWQPIGKGGDTGWVAVTNLASGWSQDSTALQVRRIGGNRVWMQGGLVDSAFNSASFVTAATIPAAFAPPGTRVFPMQVGVGSTRGARILATGEVQVIGTPASGSAFRFDHVNYLTD